MGRLTARDEHGNAYYPKGGYIDDEDRDCILKNILASIIVDFKSVVGK